MRTLCPAPTTRATWGLGAALCAALLAGCAGPQVGRTVDASLPGSRRTRVADVREFGPFYERVETSDGDIRTSVRPLFYTHIDAPKDQSSLTEILWPLYASRTNAERRNWRFLTIYGRDADTTDPDSERHVWAFPFWAHGRTAGGEQYAALFPFGGRLYDFLMYDRLSFVLWPVWMSTERHGIHGWSVLWPIVTRSWGEGHDNFRVWPFWGRVHKDGEWDRHFVLWPLWNDATFTKDGRPDGSAWALLPIAGHTDRPTVEAWHILPPFFQVARGRGRFEGDRQILAPWPLVRVSDFRGTHKRHFYPLYATTWTATDSKTHVLWPFYTHHHEERGNGARDDWSLAPLFHRTRVSGSTNGADRAYTRLWPLFSYIDEADGRYFRLLDFSLHRRVGPLERNLLQMPVVYTHGSDGALREDELLWGLFRWRRDDSATRELQLWPLFRRSREDPETDADWRVLLGLLGREGAGEDRRTRLLWFLQF